MNEIEKKDLDISAIQNTETKKNWETPQLKVLPVPTKTHGGSFLNPAQADDAFYRKS